MIYRIILCLLVLLVSTLKYLLTSNYRFGRVLFQSGIAASANFCLSTPVTRGSIVPELPYHPALARVRF